MGPSILAAAATTFAAASISEYFLLWDVIHEKHIIYQISKSFFVSKVFGCKVLFFTKFAMILFQTMLHSTLGSFVVFLCLTDIFGPREPTKAIDNLLSKCGVRKTTSNDEKLDHE